MAIVEIKVPDIGDIDEVAVIELLVKVGDTIKPEQSLITVESDKASMEIPASEGGVVTELKVKLGDKVKQGSIVILLEAAANSVPKMPVQAVDSAGAAPKIIASYPRVRSLGARPYLVLILPRGMTAVIGGMGRSEPEFFGSEVSFLGFFANFSLR